MAFVNKHVILGSSLEAPEGHSQTDTDPGIVDFDFTESQNITVPCSGVVDTTAIAGFDALFTAIETTIDGVISSDFGIDTSGNSVDYVFIVSGIYNEDSEALYLNDATRNFRVVGTLKVKVY